MTKAEPQGMLTKGLSLLVALGRHPHGATVTDVARDARLPISTVHRLLATEVALEFVTFEPATKRYRLGARIFELAHKVTSVISVAEAARPTMRELSRATGETVQLAVLSNDRALFIEKVETDQAVGISGSVGASEPVHVTSTGKVLLSQLDEAALGSLLERVSLDPSTENSITDPATFVRHLEQVRAQGYAVANEEFDHDVRAIAVPIRDGRQAVRAALCISAPAFRVSLDGLVEWLPELRKAAASIGVQLPTDS